MLEVKASKRTICCCWTLLWQEQKTKAQRESEALVHVERSCYRSVKVSRCRVNRVSCCPPLLCSFIGCCTEKSGQRDDSLGVTSYCFLLIMELFPLSAAWWKPKGRKCQGGGGHSIAQIKCYFPSFSLWAVITFTVCKVLPFWCRSEASVVLQFTTRF